MDAELRGNGERPGTMPDKTIAEEIAFFDEELYEKPRKKVRAHSMLLLAAGIFTMLFCVICVAEINSYGQRARMRRDMTRFQQLLYLGRVGTWQFEEELTRYEKNLQRFFIHYDGFDPDSFREVTAATADEISRLKIEHEIIYQQAVREIMDNYNERLLAVEEGLYTESGMLYVDPGYGTVIEHDDGTTSIVERGVALEQGDGSRTSVTISREIPEEYNEYSRLIRERDALIAGAREKYLISDEQAAGIIEQNKQANTVYDVSNYYEIKAYLENAGYFQYCLRDAKTGEYMTNIPPQYLATYKNPLEYVEENVEYYISIQDDYFSTFFNDAPLNEAFKSAGISGYIVIPDNYGTNNPVAALFNEKYFTDGFYRNLSVITVICCVIAAALWWLFLKSDKSGVKKAESAVKKLYRKLPFVVKGGMLIAAAAVLVEYSDAFNTFYYGVYNRGVIAAAIPFKLYLFAATAAVLYILLCLTHLWEFIRKPSIILNEPELRLVSMFFKNIGVIYRQQVLGISLAMTFLVISYILVQIALMVVAFGIGYFPVEVLIICEVIINILALYVFGLVAALAKTNKYMDAVIAGDLEIEINERGMYRGVINKLNRLRGGVRRVVVEKNKSEKMKADLITNVSHDLKTPLTSIINYIELLKSPQISDADKAEYIDVLDRKAQRVKHLIDDLFEATKLSSGQITLQKEQLNVVNLLKQAVGELEEKFIEAEISLKLTYTDEDIPVIADGKKLWRVFENLFTNIIKYSQPGTRAYVDVCSRGGFAEVVFKNISYYELNFEYSELFERFRRGDAARSTEGSGLGLSIAKDIAELHDGTLEISIDGDLFKAVVRLPED